MNRQEGRGLLLESKEKWSKSGEFLMAYAIRDLFKNFTCIFFAAFFFFCLPNNTRAQDNLEVTFDSAAPTIPLPQIFVPDIDLGGRGATSDKTWPRVAAASEVLDIWRSEIGFTGVYRLQLNLWEISQLDKEKELQEKLLGNYEKILKMVTDSGGLVILNVFSTPPGLGSVLDKKSYPVDLKAFKTLIKKYVRRFSCKNRFNVWYEVWNAPDLDDFFLGGEQEYLSLYRMVAEAILELREETKMFIPIGGPSSSWWFQNFDGNTVVTPERSLIYDLIRFCYKRKLPLDFISWHGFSSDPLIEKERTRYNQNAVSLIREWLSYFNFDSKTPLIIDEWNYDSGLNVVPERREKANIGSSYIISRLKNMYEAGVDKQVFFSLEDFQNNEEGINRNVGIFWVGRQDNGYEGGPKATYNIFKMLAKLGKEFYPGVKTGDDFVDVICSKSPDEYAIIIYNYIDTDIFRNYVSRNISVLNAAERKILLGLIKKDKFEKIMRNDPGIGKLHVTKKLRSLLNKAREIGEKAQQLKNESRQIKVIIKNLGEEYVFQRYVVDAGCTSNCGFIPIQEKTISAAPVFQETLSLSPYSVNLILLKKKVNEPKAVTEEKSGGATSEREQKKSAPAEEVVVSGKETLSVPENTKKENPVPEKQP